MNNKEILRVKNLGVSFNNEQILKNINFKIDEKEVLVILGPNGAGKSTLLRAILDLIKHTGKVTWNTKNISYLPPQEFFARKNLPPLKVKEFFKIKNVSKKEILNILNSVKLEKTILNKQFTELSTGQFQRMVIAWSLVDKPKVLIFDEPTSGIDIGGEETIYTLLHKFWEKLGLTIILVTHDLNIVWEHSSKVLCLNKKTLCLGKAQEVLTIENLKKLYGTGIKFYKHNHGDN
ncbi:ATP-binding cassette domain-containing protein [Candidatus Dependentiae bacterium]|nr:ATP-binding cassette domain-containing protein [Candidatus Dependentiae bacterium]